MPGLRTALKMSTSKAVTTTDRKLHKEVISLNSDLKIIDNDLTELTYKNLEEDNRLINTQKLYNAIGTMVVSDFNDTFDYQELIINNLKSLSQIDFLVRKHIKLVEFKTENLIDKNLKISMKLLISDDCSTNITAIGNTLNTIQYPNFSSWKEIFVLQETKTFQYTEPYNSWIVPKNNSKFSYYRCPSEDYANLLLDKHPNISSNDYEISNVNPLDTEALQFITIDPLYLLAKLYNNLNNTITDKVTV
tara:strand:- start:84 stop:827 length:744 start_codon:yes stop_codon:yes gene_type:complete